MFFGESSPEDIITRISLDGSKTEDLLGMDFMIDMTATARNIEYLFWYYRFKNFLCYRNGFASFPHPRIDVKFRNHVVPSKQNQVLFRRAGHEAECVYYGIPEFYSPGRSDEYWKMFEEKYNLVEKEYFLFPHRPHPDKGVNYIPALAKTFPDKKFVIAANTPILEHQMFLNEIRVLVNKEGLKNLLIVDMPLNPKHHYYKRELMRRAKAVLSPIIPPYFEGFGLANCLPPTEIIVTDKSLKKLQDVQAGDMVLTHTGQYKPVKRVYLRFYTGNVVGIRPHGGKRVFLTPEHPVYAVKRPKKVFGATHMSWAEQKARWIPARELQKGDAVVFPVVAGYTEVKSYDLLDYVEPIEGFRCHYCGHEFIMRTPEEKFVNHSRQCNRCHHSKYLEQTRLKNVIALENTGKIHLRFASHSAVEGVNRIIPLDIDFAKILGFYIAEGSIGGKDDGYFDVCQVDSSPLIDEMYQLIRKVFGIHVNINRREGKVTRLVCTGKLVSHFIKSTCGKCSTGKKIPREILYGSDLRILETLVEYMVKGDGCIDEGGVHYYTTSRQLAYDLKIACIRLGYRPRITESKRRTTIFSGCQSESIRQPLYNITWCLDKRNYIHSNKSWNGVDGIYYLIDDIKEEPYNGMVYNLEVGDDNSFTTSAFAVHNCETIACGTPVIISDSPSTRELWRDRIDVLVVEGEFGFKMAIENIDSYQLKPENRYMVANYAKGYLDLIFKKMMNSQRT